MHSVLISPTFPPQNAVCAHTIHMKMHCYNSWLRPCGILWYLEARLAQKYGLQRPHTCPISPITSKSSRSCNNIDLLHDVCVTCRENCSLSPQITWRLLLLLLWCISPISRSGSLRWGWERPSVLYKYVVCVCVRLLLCCCCGSSCCFFQHLISYSVLVC